MYMAAENRLEGFIYDQYGYVEVHADGCCLRNGQGDPVAGYGVWFNDHHYLNLYGKALIPTNNNAEIEAATKAILQAKKANIKKLRIKTDSTLVINGMTKWMSGWKQNNWKNSKNLPVVNTDMFMKLDNARQNMEIEWEHVVGHSGVYGNEQADKLAKKGAALN